MNSKRFNLLRNVKAGCWLTLAAFPAAVSFADDAGASSPMAGPLKTHTLFVGAEVSVEWEKSLHPVEEVTGASIVIKPNDKVVKVPLRDDVSLFIKDALKVADTNVEISNLKTERAYTPDADPFQQMVKSVTMASSNSAVADLAQGRLMQANTVAIGAGARLEAARGTMDEGAAAQSAAQSMAWQAEAEAAVMNAYNAPVSTTEDVATSSVEAGVAMSRQGYDAIRVSFEVTPDRDLTEPYYLVVAEIREPDSKPGHVRKWAYMKSLGPMKAGKTGKVNIYQGGMPRGYVIEDCKVHLFDHRDEMATNLSSRRLQITEGEALDFRIIDYVAANKGRTLPASPATALASAEQSKLSPAQLDATCHVQIGKDGHVIAVFRDAAGRKPLNDTALENALKTLRFNPALDAGKPVESTFAVVAGKL